MEWPKSHTFVTKFSFNFFSFHVVLKLATDAKEIKCTWSSAIIHDGNVHKQRSSTNSIFNGCLFVCVCASAVCVDSECILNSIKSSFSMLSQQTMSLVLLLPVFPLQHDKLVIRLFWCLKCLVCGWVFLFLSLSRLICILLSSVSSVSFLTRFRFGHHCYTNRSVLLFWFDDEDEKSETLCRRFGLFDAKICTLMDCFCFSSDVSSCVFLHTWQITEYWYTLLNC